MSKHTPEEVAVGIVSTFQRRAKVALGIMEKSISETAEEGGWTRQSFYQALRQPNPTIKTVSRVAHAIYPGRYLVYYLLGNGTIDDMVRYLHKQRNLDKEIRDGFQRNV